MSNVVMSSAAAALAGVSGAPVANSPTPGAAPIDGESLFGGVLATLKEAPAAPSGALAPVLAEAVKSAGAARPECGDDGEAEAMTDPTAALAPIAAPTQPPAADTPFGAAAPEPVAAASTDLPVDAVRPTPAGRPEADRAPETASGPTDDSARPAPASPTFPERAPTTAAPRSDRAPEPVAEIERPRPHLPPEGATVAAPPVTAREDAAQPVDGDHASDAPKRPTPTAPEAAAPVPARAEQPDDGPRTTALPADPRPAAATPPKADDIAQTGAAGNADADQAPAAAPNAPSEAAGAEAPAAVEAAPPSPDAGAPAPAVAAATEAGTERAITRPVAADPAASAGMLPAERKPAAERPAPAPRPRSADAPAPVAAPGPAPVAAPGPTPVAADADADGATSPNAIARTTLAATAPQDAPGRPVRAVEAPARPDAPAPTEQTPRTDPGFAELLKGGDPAVEQRRDPLVQHATHRFQTAMAQQTPAAQVAFSIARGVAEAPDRIRMQLYPRELGEVEVTLEFHENRRTEVVIRAERPETMDLLQKDARELQRALQNAGLDVRDNGLSFELGGRDRGSDREDAHERRGGGRSAARTDNEALTAAAPPPSWRSVTPGGVDLLA